MEVFWGGRRLCRPAADRRRVVAVKRTYLEVVVRGY